MGKRNSVTKEVGSRSSRAAASREQLQGAQLLTQALLQRDLGLLERVPKELLDEVTFPCMGVHVGTALTIAAAEGWLAGCVRLIELGADVNGGAQAGRYLPLQASADQGNEEISSHLLSCGAQTENTYCFAPPPIFSLLDGSSPQMISEAINKTEPNAVLYHSVNMGDGDHCLLAIERGAKPTGKFGEMLIGIANHAYASAELYEILIEAGAFPRPDQLDEVIKASVTRDRAKLASSLLATGVPPEAFDAALKEFGSPGVEACVNAARAMRLVTSRMPGNKQGK